MPDYEVTFPSAQGMIEQERLSVSEKPKWQSDAMRKAFEQGDVAETVSILILRDDWREAFAPQLNQVYWLVEKLSNVPAWQVHLLKEVIRTIEWNDRREIYDRHTLHITTEYRFCPIHGRALEKYSDRANYCFDCAKEGDHTFNAGLWPNYN